MLFACNVNAFEVFNCVTILDILVEHWFKLHNRM